LTNVSIQQKLRKGRKHAFTKFSAKKLQYFHAQFGMPLDNMLNLPR
jgi:hypothetical protein